MVNYRKARLLRILLDTFVHLSHDVAIAVHTLAVKWLYETNKDHARDFVLPVLNRVWRYLNYIFLLKSVELVKPNLTSSSRPKWVMSSSYHLAGEDVLITSLSLSHTHTHTHTHTRTHIYTHKTSLPTLFMYLSLFLSVFVLLSLYLTHTHSRTLFFAARASSHIFWYDWWHILRES